MPTTFSFKDSTGRSVTVEKIRRLATDILKTQSIYVILEGDTLDLIAVKMYGQGNERLRSLIIEKNMSKLIDNGFDISTMIGETLDIPPADQATRVVDSVIIPNAVSFDDL